MTKPRIDWPKLREAAAIIDGIPAKRFNLDLVHSQTSRNGFPADAKPDTQVHSCGSLGCAIGWLACHPSFNDKLRLGVVSGAVSGSYVHLQTKRPGESSWSNTSFAYAAMNVFGLPRFEASDLFGPVYGHERCSPSDKILFRQRIVRLFDRYDQPVSPAYRKAAGL